MALNAVTRREAEVAMGRAHNSEKGWTLGSQGAGMAAPNCAGETYNRASPQRSSNHPRQLDNAEAQMVTSMPIGFDIIPARAGDDLADSDAETSHRHDKPTG
ncbi:jg8964 [Pararge aegeria aegeria]|uniref:Jg8964 protein n=1 Tax=Pararge aegeria aegeria TaxID=348720 RepID=A0A8S4SBJ3_9NEOP|nr:jg8964 [Pararge aegeria aegeria]